jgi:hypothetical protein
VEAGADALSSLVLRLAGVELGVCLLIHLHWV